jgi:3'-phosphoadenosine 5'-phosphosulfate sulfotransferase (PAPS reductase)/FAD synthetase|tara:strand:- start:2449 stop:5295 length:2847 start_codon:yes stop_codon:yes gene_type:complete
MTFDIPIELLDNATPIGSVASVDGSSYSDTLLAASYDLFRKAVDDIKIVRQSYCTVSALSNGKDSALVLLAGLQAHIELMDEGLLDSSSPFIISHINTGVENHLMEALSGLEFEKITAYCKLKNINLDLRIGSPPLHKSWAALYLSGLKLISTARNNNDCSVQLKVDNAKVIEKQIERDYGKDVVVLLGVRFGESNRRTANIRQRGTEKTTAQSLVSGGSSDLTFAPIITMTDDDVWGLLKIAGSDPIVKHEKYNLASYAENHRLLHLIYSDSKSGSCPTTARKVQGQSPGGCGASARTGCSLCAKSVQDNSGEAQIRETRHFVIAKNIVSVRNYIMYIAQDVDYRTWHGRATDKTIDHAVALQPNVLNAESLEKLIFLLSQVTCDDYFRAKKFKALVDAGQDLMLDEGYADIVQDSSLDEKDRAVLLEAYTSYAQKHLIRPMSYELAVYLSAIHSRDGVRLPPFRALHIWQEVVAGKRIPYPDVDPKLAKVDDIPDAVMVIPSKVPNASFLGNEILDRESSVNCDSYATPVTSKLSVKDARLLVGADLINDNLKGSATIDLNNFKAVKWFDIVRKKPLSCKPKVQFSKRRITKRRKVKGQSLIVSRGRTSLDSPSFGVRSETPNLSKAYLKPVHAYLPSSELSYDLIIDDEELSASYDIDTLALSDWEQFDGLASALEKHDHFVESRTAKGETIYKYGGVGAFEHLLRWGVFKMNARSRLHTLRILERTNYFNSLGLFSLDDSEIKKIACGLDVDEQSALTSKIAQSHIESILNMGSYRTFKANFLLGIRSKRNTQRKEVKRLIASFSSDAYLAACEQIESMFESVKDMYVDVVMSEYLSLSLVCNKVAGFDGTNYQNLYVASCGSQRYIESFFAGESGLKRAFDTGYLKLLNESNPDDYQKLIDFNNSKRRSLLGEVRRSALLTQQQRHGQGIITTKEEMLAFRKV